MAERSTTPNAESARRYRARKRGDAVPLRRPGPKPAQRFPAGPYDSNQMRREWAALQRKYGDVQEFWDHVHRSTGCTAAVSNDPVARPIRSESDTDKAKRRAQEEEDLWNAAHARREAVARRRQHRSASTDIPKKATRA